MAAHRMPTVDQPPAWGALARAIAGEVVLPDSPAYDAVRRPAVARFEAIRPQAVARCRTAADVAETLSFAQRSGLRTAIRSGGHCFAGHSSTRGLLIDVTPMCGVTVSGGVARIGAGARLGAVYDALSGHGRTIPAGCGASVGIAGLTLGGGLGILGRTHGLTCDSLRAAEIVLADGRSVECDEDRHPELFWALRGAGAGHFGVVTGLVFDTLPAPEMTRLRLTWPHTQAAAVVEVWQAWAPAAPRELAASLLLTASADVDEPPAVCVSGAMLGIESDAVGQLEALVGRVGADPVSAEHAQAPHREIKDQLATRDAGGDHDDGHAYSRSEFFSRRLPPAAVAALVRHLVERRVPGQGRELDFTPWAGAYNDVPADATAFAHRRARFLLKHTVVVGADAAPATHEAARRWLAQSFLHARPWGSGRVYPNFPDADLEHPGRAYYAANLPRLRRVKATYDPHERFRSPQPLAPAR